MSTAKNSTARNGTAAGVARAVWNGAVLAETTLWVPITLSQPLTWYLLLNEALPKWVSGGERA